MNASFPSMMNRLLAALEAAMSADTVEATRLALDEAFGVLGALYAALDSGRHPDLSAYLLRAYDGCLRHIGEARPGQCQGLIAAITLLRHIQQAEECAQDGSGDRASVHGHAAAVV
jgi:hypothetical protein